MQHNNAGICKHLNMPKEEVARFNKLKPLRESFKSQDEFEKAYLLWTVSMIQKEKFYLSLKQ